MKVKMLMLVALALLIITSLASAQTYSIYSRIINIQVDAEGKAKISEKFFLGFPTEQEKINFRTKSTELGSDIDKWTVFNSAFGPSVGSNNIINGKISYTESQESYLELNYELSDALMSKGKDATLMTEYSLKAIYFNKFYETNLWVIPGNTRISIELPPGAEIKDTIDPPAEISANGLRRVVTWQGYKKTNSLTLNYVMWKKVVPAINLNQLTDILFKTQEGLTFFGIIIIIILAVAWKRKKIISKIENFVENNSVIEE